MLAETPMLSAPTLLAGRYERTFGRLKLNHAIATRYDQMPSSFLGIV